MKKLCCVLILALQDVQTSITSYTIQGRVSYMNGTPAPNMEISVQGLYEPATLEAHVWSNAQGMYTVPNLHPGQYVIYPYNSTEQYPIRNNMFLSNSLLRVRTGSTENISQNIVLPAEAGQVIGTVLNKDGDHLKDATVVLCHAEAPNRSAEIHTSNMGTFDYIVPSNEALSILIQAPSGVMLQQTDIVVKPDERKAITFKLGTRTELHGAKCIPFRPGTPLTAPR